MVKVLRTRPDEAEDQPQHKASGPDALGGYRFQGDAPEVQPEVSQPDSPEPAESPEEAPKKSPKWLLKIPEETSAEAVLERVTKNRLKKL